VQSGWGCASDLHSSRAMCIQIFKSTALEMAEIQGGILLASSVYASAYFSHFFSGIIEYAFFFLIHSARVHEIQKLTVKKICMNLRIYCSHDLRAYWTSVFFLFAAYIEYTLNNVRPWKFFLLFFSFSLSLSLRPIWPLSIETNDWLTRKNENV
jgi:hypothetical protein